MRLPALHFRKSRFSLQANAKAIEGAQHPDRDAQFGYLNDQARDHIDSSDPAKRNLPIVATNVGGVWELLEAREGRPPGGWVVPMDDVDALSRTLTEKTGVAPRRRS